MPYTKDILSDAGNVINDFWEYEIPLLDTRYPLVN